MLSNSLVVGGFYPKEKTVSRCLALKQRSANLLRCIQLQVPGDKQVDDSEKLIQYDNHITMRPGGTRVKQGGRYTPSSASQG